MKIHTVKYENFGITDVIECSMTHVNSSLALFDDINPTIKLDNLIYISGSFI